MEIRSESRPAKIKGISGSISPKNPLQKWKKVNEKAKKYERHAHIVKTERQTRTHEVTYVGASKTQPPHTHKHQFFQQENFP